MKNKQLIYKMNAALNYLKGHGRCMYEVYNKLCFDIKNPDSSIVEYMEDIIEIIEEILNIKISKILKN